MSEWRCYAILRPLIQTITIPTAPHDVFKDQFAGVAGVISAFLIGLGSLSVAVKPYLSRAGEAFKFIDTARKENVVLIDKEIAKRWKVLEAANRSAVKVARGDSARAEVSDELKHLEQQDDD